MVMVRKKLMNECRSFRYSGRSAGLDAEHGSFRWNDKETGPDHCSPLNLCQLLAAGNIFEKSTSL